MPQIFMLIIRQCLVAVNKFKIYNGSYTFLVHPKIESTTRLKKLKVKTLTDFSYILRLTVVNMRTAYV